MGQMVALRASDGHELGAYCADPSGTPWGGVVVLQEIFGVNDHIRDVCDRFAAEDFFAIAPALYDRSSRKDVRLGYGPEDVRVGRMLREEFSWDATVLDVDAAREVVSEKRLKVGTVGFCWGGTISFLAATRLQVQASVVYYGGQIGPYVSEQERCPLLMHFGKKDHTIPLSEVETIRVHHPRAMIHLYDTGHGFNCDRRSDYHELSAEQAWKRTLAFFAEHLAG